MAIKVFLKGSCLSFVKDLHFEWHEKFVSLRGYGVTRELSQKLFLFLYDIDNGRILIKGKACCELFLLSDH